MEKENNVLRELKASLDEEHGNEFIALIKKHHELIRDCIPPLINDETSVELKQTTLLLFFELFRMHAKAEEETLYSSLEKTDFQEVRLEGLVGQDEHDLALELFDELMHMGYETKWDEEVDAKVNVLTSLVKGHLRQEENEMFPLTEKYLSDLLPGLVDDYIEKCKTYLNIAMKIVPEDMTSDMRVLFY